MIILIKNSKGLWMNPPTSRISSKYLTSVEPLGNIEALVEARWKVKKKKKLNTFLVPLPNPLLLTCSKPEVIITL